jgi:hypothetical protein
MMNVKKRAAVCFLAVFFLSPNLWGQKSPVVPEDVWQALANEISGDIALEDIRYLTQFHSPNAASEGFRQSAKWIAGRAREVGLQDVKMLSSKTPTRGWTIHGGEAWIVEPFELKLGDVRETPLRVADNSHSVDITAELVDVGEGDEEADYENISVEGKIVLASGNPDDVHDLAVWEHGAVGVVSMDGRRATLPDQLPWHRISEKNEDGQAGSFAWLLTPREGARLRRALESAKAKGEVVRARVKVDAEFSESTEGILEGWIRGTDPTQPAVVLIAHLQEEKTSANDNRSGCASLLEIARAITAAIENEKLERPARSIRFWWVDEIRAPYQFFADNPDAAGSILAAVNQDMVAPKLSLGPRSVVMCRTPFSLPSYINDVAGSIFEAVRKGNTAFPFSRGDTDGGGFSRSMFAIMGTREPFQAMLVPYYDGSDHIAFVDGRVGIPAVSINNWPDEYIHSSDDDMWQVDATQLERNAFIVATTGYFLASAGESDMGPLSSLLLGGAQKRLTRDSAAALERIQDGSAGEPASRYRDAAMLMEIAAWRELAAIDSAFVFTSKQSPGGELLSAVRADVGTLAELLRKDVDRFFEKSTGTAPPVEMPPEEAEAAKRVPEWAVPLGESLTKLREANDVGGLHPFYVMEVHNLINGKRSVLDIYRAVRAASLSAGEWYYGPVELAKVIEVLEAAETVGVVNIRGK